jgi:hypothetical protein
VGNKRIKSKKNFFFRGGDEVRNIKGKKKIFFKGGDEKKNFFKIKNKITKEKNITKIKK